MSPADQLAKTAKAFLEDTRAGAYTHNWTAGEMILFIDNKKTLHGREAVLDESDVTSRVIERAAYYLEPR